MRASRMFALLMFLVSGGVVIGQEKVDNPDFAGWVKFKKGARVTHKSVIVSDGLETEMVQIVTLLDLTADKAVLELKGMTKTVAKEYKIEPATIDVLRQVPLPPGVKPEEFANKPPGFVKGGTETVKLAAGEFKTKWFETERKFDGTVLKGKYWVADDVPGGVVKSETTVIGATKQTTKTELVEVKKP